MPVISVFFGIVIRMSIGSTVSPIFTPNTRGSTPHSPSTVSCWPVRSVRDPPSGWSQSGRPRTVRNLKPTGSVSRQGDRSRELNPWTEEALWSSYRL